MLEFETILAKASADRVSMRDPNKRYHIMTRKELAALAPDFDWEAYFKLVGAPAFETLNVSQPDFFKQLEATLPGQPSTPGRPTSPSTCCARAPLSCRRRSRTRLSISGSTT